MSSQKSKPKLFLKSFFTSNLTCGCGIKPNKIPDVHHPKPIIPNKSPIYNHDQILSLTSNCENLVKNDDQRQEKVVEEEKEEEKASSTATLSLSIDDNSHLVTTSTTTTTSTTATTTTNTTTNNSSPEPEIEPDTQIHTTPAESSSSTSSSSITNRRRRLSFRSPSKIGESIAVVKESNDPYFDFKQSMLQMIYEKEIFSGDDLKELLDCFLKLNSSCHHAIIVKAFNEIWNDVLACAATTAVIENSATYSKG